MLPVLGPNLGLSSWCRVGGPDSFVTKVIAGKEGTSRLVAPCRILASFHLPFGGQFVQEDAVLPTVPSCPSFANQCTSSITVGQQGVVPESRCFNRGSGLVDPLVCSRLMASLPTMLLE